MAHRQAPKAYEPRHDLEDNADALYMSKPGWTVTEDDMAMALRIVERMGFVEDFAQRLVSPTGRRREHCSFVGLIVALTLNTMLPDTPPHLAKATVTLYEVMPWRWRQRYHADRYSRATPKRRKAAEKSVERLWKKFRLLLDSQPMPLNRRLTEEEADQGPLGVPRRRCGGQDGRRTAVGLQPDLRSRHGAGPRHHHARVAFLLGAHAMRLMRSWLRNADRGEKGVIIAPPLKHRRGKGRRPWHSVPPMPPQPEPQEGPATRRSVGPVPTADHRARKARFSGSGVRWSHAGRLPARPFQAEPGLLRPHLRLDLSSTTTHQEFSAKGPDCVGGLLAIPSVRLRAVDGRSERAIWRRLAFP